MNAKKLFSLPCWRCGVPNYLHEVFIIGYKRGMPGGYTSYAAQFPRKDKKPLVPQYDHYTELPKDNLEWLVYKHETKGKTKKKR